MSFPVKTVFLIATIALVFAALYQPFLLGIPILALLLLLCMIYPIEKTTQILWYILIISAFFGSFLSLPGFNTLFLYRILLPIHVLLFCLTYQKENRLTGLNIRYFQLLLLFLVTGFIPLIWAEYPIAVLRNLYYVAEAIYLIYTSVYYLRNATFRQNLLRLIPIALLINIGIAFYEITTGQHLTKSTLSEAIGNALYLPSGVFFNPNDLAAFLTLFIPIYIVFYTKKTWGVRLFKIALGVIGMYIVIATESRICIVLLALMLLVIVFSYSKKWLIALVAAALLFVPIILGTSSFQTLSDSIENIYTGKQNSTDVRIGISEAAWQLTQDNYLIGAGPGNAQLQLVNYFPTDELSNNGTIAVHNFLLELLANYGIQSAIFFYSFLILILVQSIRHLFTNADQKIMPLLLSIALIVLFFSSSTTLEKPYIWISFGIILAILTNKRMEQPHV